MYSLLMFLMLCKCVAFYGRIWGRLCHDQYGKISEWPNILKDKFHVEFHHILSAVYEIGIKSSFMDLT
jgi:hypothetical protein